ncbi:hypothetical protein [Hydrogenophaga sp.]|uniref:hypothetical protein n=1 Tax=Hydrogenophaga sp. TaxID=1904254 RepID=UPI0027315A96|nr:hypothetical protein [Hydrogenophaga sp.]MDP2018019.1 hypothetical protein [Hydrogenophaga sp.]
MTNVETLFLNTLRDLALRAAAEDEYTVLGCSALIRKLLIDGAPLVDQVNQTRRLKITFEISDSQPSVPGLSEPTVWSVQDGLDPESSRPGMPRKLANRDQLLSTVVAIVEGRSYTLRDVVLFEANVMGGVHAGSAREDKETVLQALNTQLTMGGHRASLRQLQAISRVVLRGLEPLRSAVVAAGDS